MRIASTRELNFNEVVEQLSKVSAMLMFRAIDSEFPLLAAVFSVMIKLYFQICWRLAADLLQASYRHFVFPPVIFLLDYKLLFLNRKKYEYNYGRR
jgi:hypothetical protein